MFVDSSAIVALMSDESEARRVADAIASAAGPMTSPVAVLEVVLALARRDKFDRPVAEIEPMVLEFLDSRDIEVRDPPPAPEATRLALRAAHRYRGGRRGLNLADGLHYACAKHLGVPILATHDEFRLTDLQVIA